MMLMKELARRIALATVATLAVLLTICVTLSLADEPSPDLALSSDQTWVALTGALVPLLMYVINHYAPWVSEKAKAIAQVAAAALVGALWQLHSNGSLDLGSAETLQFSLTAVVSALVAHGLLYAPGGINKALLAGTNKQDS